MTIAVGTVSRMAATAASFVADSSNALLLTESKEVFGTPPVLLRTFEGATAEQNGY